MTQRIEEGEGYTISYVGQKLDCLDYDEALYRVALIPVGLVKMFEKLPNRGSWEDIQEFVREAIRLRLQEEYIHEKEYALALARHKAKS